MRTWILRGLGAVAFLGLAASPLSLSVSLICNETQDARPAPGNVRPVDWDRDITTYNCAGLAFGTYRNMQLEEVESILSRGRRLRSPAEPCEAGQLRIWFWKYKLHLEMGGVEVQPRGALKVDDFHIVAGPVRARGFPPQVVFSKNGEGPVEGPADPESFAPAHRLDLGLNTEGHAIFAVRENIVESWYAIWPGEVESRETDIIAEARSSALRLRPGGSPRRKNYK